MLLLLMLLLMVLREVNDRRSDAVRSEARGESLKRQMICVRRMDRGESLKVHVSLHSDCMRESVIF